MREIYAYVLRGETRKQLFARAQKRAQDLGRPLVVVGAASGGITPGGYTCGDLPCVDLGGCRGCDAIPTDVTLPGAIRAPDDSVVVFSSCVMELVPDIDAAWAEHLRAAGSPDNVFVAHIEPWAHTSWMYPGTVNRIFAAPPNGRELLYLPTWTRPGTPAR